MKAALRIYATGLWTGFFPVAPGTAGSLLAVGLWCWIPLPLGCDGHLGVGVLVFLVAATLLGIPASGLGEREFGKDGSPIVIDEVVGQWIALAGLAPAPAVAVGGFLLFRIFDIVKPFPIRQSHALPGGWGVVADDVLAGIATNLTLRLVVLLGIRL